MPLWIQVEEKGWSCMERILGGLDFFMIPEVYSETALRLPHVGGGSNCGVVLVEDGRGNLEVVVCRARDGRLNYDENGEGYTTILEDTVRKHPEILPFISPITRITKTMFEAQPMYFEHQPFTPGFGMLHGEYAKESQPYYKRMVVWALPLFCQSLLAFCEAGVGHGDLTHAANMDFNPFEQRLVFYDLNLHRVSRSKKKEPDLPPSWVLHWVFAGTKFNDHSPVTGYKHMPVKADIEAIIYQALKEAQDVEDKAPAFLFQSFGLGLVDICPTKSLYKWEYDRFEKKEFREELVHFIHQLTLFRRTKSPCKYTANRVLLYATRVLETQKKALQSLLEKQKAGEEVDSEEIVRLKKDLEELEEEKAEREKKIKELQKVIEAIEKEKKKAEELARLSLIELAKAATKAPGVPFTYARKSFKGQFQERFISEHEGEVEAIFRLYGV